MHGMEPQREKERERERVREIGKGKERDSNDDVLSCQGMTIKFGVKCPVLATLYQFV